MSILEKLYLADPSLKTGFKAKSGNIVTPVAVGSFVYLLKPQEAMEDAEDKTPKYAITLLFPAEADLTLMKEAASAATIAEWGSDQSKWPRKPGLNEGDPDIILLRSPFRDQGEKAYEGYVRGRKFVTLTSKIKPEVVNAANMPINDASMIYSGMWCRATINPFTYKKKGNSGVSFGLQNVQKIADGDPLSGRAKAESEFAPVAVPAGAGGVAAAPSSIFD